MAKIIKSHLLSVVWLAAILGLGYFFFPSRPEPQPQFKFECSFVASRKDQAPIRFGDIAGPIESARIQGHLTPTSQKTLYNLAGDIVFQAAGKKMSSRVDGSVFTSGGNVDALSIYVGSDPLADSLFTIATLNKDGNLDFNKSEAFLFSQKEFKFSHPVNFECSKDSVPA